MRVFGTRLRGRTRHASLLFFVLLPGLATCQETTGSIRGTVTDASTLAVSDSIVEVSSPALVRPLETRTDEAGAYLFPSLPPGGYSVRVSAPGFTTSQQTGFELQIGKTLRVDFKLSVGSISETVSVTADAGGIDTQTSTQITNVSAAAFDRLTKDRGFDSLIALAPGARAEPKSGGYQIDGASGSENVFLIDGVDNTNLQTGTLPRISQMPVEQIQEVQVKSGAFDAQFGGSTGGVVSAVIRSGSNDFHGQASLYLETDALNAGPRPTLRLDPGDDNRAGYFHNRRDGYRMMNPGISIGGPIQKDKLWFFSSWYPEFREYERQVSFLDSGETGLFKSTERTDFLVTKLDYAPTEKIRSHISYVYSPDRVHGFLPNQQGTDSASNPWSQRGSRAPAASYNFGADIVLTPQLTFSTRGGYNYRNFKDTYGIPGGVYYNFANSNTNLPDSLPVPTQFLGSAGNMTPDNITNQLDRQTRFNFNGDAVYFANWKGQHTLKAGYQANRLSNDVLRDFWPDGNITVFWNLAYPALTKPGAYRGAYGYYIDSRQETIGSISSMNHSLYMQDTWRISPRLTINLGLRAERETIPSFAQPGLSSRTAIQFPFYQKLAPRAGAAWDVRGDGKLKLFGSFGMFYDQMKFEASRVSFGGEKRVDSVYPLNTPDFTSIRPGQGIDLIESYDHRIPANDPADNRIDPNVRPTRQQKYEGGLEFNPGGDYIFTARYTHQQLDRAIENVGVLGKDGTEFYVANPGYGLAANPSVYPAGVLPPPKAMRHYDALDFGLRKHLSKKMQFVASYTWSRLYGDYSGLASSDDKGDTSPNSTSYYDLPWMSIDQRGQFVRGRLATDRPHTFKLFGTYFLKTRLGETNFSPRFYAFSGTPLSTALPILGDPVFVLGRGDLGRTPFYSNTDFMVTHEFSPTVLKEKGRIRLEMNVSNLFNQATVTGRNTLYTNPNDRDVQFDPVSDMYRGFDFQSVVEDQGLRVNPQYGLANSFQSPRGVRLALHFIF